MKHSTSRDFRINAAVLQAAIEQQDDSPDVSKFYLIILFITVGVIGYTHVLQLDKSSELQLIHQQFITVYPLVHKLTCAGGFPLPFSHSPELKIRTIGQCPQEITQGLSIHHNNTPVYNFNPNFIIIIYMKFTM